MPLRDVFFSILRGFTIEQQWLIKDSAKVSASWNLPAKIIAVGRLLFPKLLFFNGQTLILVMHLITCRESKVWSAKPSFALPPPPHKLLSCVTALHIIGDRGAVLNCSQCRWKHPGVLRWGTLANALALVYGFNQCCASETFCYSFFGCGSGSSDPYLCPTNPDLGGSKTYWSYGSGSWSGTLVIKKERNHKTVEIKDFLTSFAFMMEESGARSRSVLVTNGSECGSRRPKKLRIRIRIHNTCFYIFREDSGDVVKNTCSLYLQTPQKLPPQLYGRFPVQVLCQTRGNKQEIGPGKPEKEITSRTGNN